MQPPKRKKRDWSDDGTWDTAVKSAAGEEARTVTVAVDGTPGEVASDGEATTIGPSIVVRGRLLSHEDLVIHGRIEAAVKSSRDLKLERSGVILADIEVRSATINGIVIGSIRATERVELTSEARVVGDIDTPALIVHDGAKFRGGIEMAGLEAVEKPKQAAPKPVREQKLKVRPAPVPVAAAVEWQDPEPAVTPEPEPPPVVIPPTRPVVVPQTNVMQAATVSSASAASASHPAPAPRSRRPAPEPVSVEPPIPAPSKRGWFSLG